MSRQFSIIRVVLILEKACRMLFRVVEEKAWICWDVFLGRVFWVSWRDRVDLRGRRREQFQGIVFIFFYIDLYKASLLGLQYCVSLFFVLVNVMCLVVVSEVFIQLSGIYQQEGILQGFCFGGGVGELGVRVKYSVSGVQGFLLEFFGIRVQIFMFGVFWSVFTGGFILVVVFGSFWSCFLVVVFFVSV